MSKQRFISPIRSANQSVADIDRAITFYHAAFDFRTLGQGVITAADQAWAKAWLMPQGMTCRFALVGPSDPKAPIVRLIQFERPGPQIWGDYKTFQDTGHFAVNYRIPEINAGWERMMAAGARPRSNPMFWTILDGVSAWESQCFDPDGVLMDVFEMQGEKVPDIFGPITGACSGVQTMAIHTNDADRAKAFYVGLGYDVFYDRVFSGLEDLIHLPKGTDLRNVNLMMPDITPMGRVEIAQYVGYPGKSLKDRARPPNTGVLSISFEAPNLAATINKALELGATLASDAADVVLPVLGNARLQSVYGPDGEVVEFFERR